jgi:hypothetical protein
MFRTWAILLAIWMLGVQPSNWALANTIVESSEVESTESLVVSSRTSATTIQPLSPRPRLVVD